MEKIVVTGSNGFFASRFIDFYKKKYEIISLNHNDLDIEDCERTLEVIQGIKPKYLIHAAAISNTALCEQNPKLSYDVNVTGTINIAKACLTVGVKMIFLSSDQVYSGNEEAGPYKETTPSVPNNIYGKHKLQAEEEVEKILDDGIILRLTWLCSLPEKNKIFKPNIIWNIARAILNNKPMKLSVNEYRGITYVYDLINNFEKIFTLPGGVYNSGCENSINTYEIGKSIFKEMGLDHRINEVLIKDAEFYRDLRMCNKKLRDYGIYFDETEKSISNCINDFSFKVL